MNINDFNKLQTVQMEIMDEVHRVCVENDIKYYIIGGTALGAKRHGGYIPWDMDIDIAMPREDYEKFEQVCEKKLSHRFVLRNFKNTKAYTHPHVLVCMNNTYLTAKFDKFNKEENLGIYMDVFPLDRAPQNEKLQEKHAKQIKNLRKLKAFKKGYRYNNDFKKAFLKKLVSGLIFWTNLDKINLSFDKLCRKYENENSGLLCSMASHYSYKKQCMPESIYGTPTLVKFEDKEYFAPEKLDEYLTRIYGDYMKLPPESERKANLDVFDTVIFDTKEAN